MGRDLKVIKDLKSQHGNFNAWATALENEAMKCFVRIQELAKNFKDNTKGASIVHDFEQSVANFKSHLTETQQCINFSLESTDLIDSKDLNIKTMG
jgi:hypothetical protein